MAQSIPSVSVEEAAFLLSQSLMKQQPWPKVDFDVVLPIFEWIQVLLFFNLIKSSFF